ncbi:MAG: hypothetical protein JRD00_13695 [Deltaproteobacteria bacterium]|nr:hypothetical protein [Deltaproteobacteria bacterium]
MSLRTKVVLSLTFLMASAMLLIGMVMLKVRQTDGFGHASDRHGHAQGEADRSGPG